MMRWAKVAAALVAVYAVVVFGVLVSTIADVGFTANDIYFIPAITGTAAGVYLTLRVPENRMGLLMTVMSAALLTLGLSNVAIPWSLDQGRETLTVAVVHLADLAWITQFVTALVLLPLWFPSGRPINPRWGWVGRVAILGGAITEISFIMSESVCAFESLASEDCITVASPWGIEGFAGFEPLILMFLAMAVPAVASTFVRWRRSDDVERHQIKWFFVAAIGLLIATAVMYLDFNLVVNDFVFATGLTGVWAAVVLAVIKYRLYDIDRIVSRTVAYTVIIGLLAAVFVGLVTAIGSRFGNSLSAAASTLAVSALFNPLRRRVQERVDRRFNRSSYDAEQVMDEFAGSLRDEVNADESIDGWVDVVEETMQPSHMGVWVRP